MTGRLVVVSGTGTEIGKTHVVEALLLHLGRAGMRVAGVKPVESGVCGGALSDSDRLARASTFHVKHAGVSLRAPVSPHLAARGQGVILSVESLAEVVRSPLREAELVLAELPGGLFTPITDEAVNADLVVRCSPDFLLLVAPDRLGVLHDVLATSRAADAQSLRIGGLVLVTPEHTDPSTGTNADELSRFTSIPILAVLPRAAPGTLADHPGVKVTAQAIQAPAGPAPA